MRKDVVHHRSKKWITKRLVLFNRYIFIRMTTARKQDFYTLRDCDGVESILGINGTPAIIPRETVAQFMLAQRRRQFDDIHVNLESGRARRNKASSRFRLGTLVRALDGPFTSFAGHVTNITGRGMIKVAIEIFGRLSPIEFEFDQIEAVDANVEAA
jgi:transcription antitermination factor NusG